MAGGASPDALLVLPDESRRGTHRTETVNPRCYAVRKGSEPPIGYGISVLSAWDDAERKTGEGHEMLRNAGYTASAGEWIESANRTIERTGGFASRPLKFPPKAKIFQKTYRHSHPAVKNIHTDL